MSAGTKSTQAGLIIAIGALLAALLPLAQGIGYGPVAPEETFMLISALPDSAAKADPSNVIHSLAGAPVYALMKWAYLYPAGFLIGGLAAHALFALALFQMIRKAIDGERTGLAAAIAALVVIASLPVLRLAGAASSGLSIAPHDGFVTFSHRTLFWSLHALAYLMYVQRRPRAMLWLAGAGALLHPTAGMLSFGFATLGAMAELVRTRKATILLHWLGAAVLCVGPTLLNQLTHAMPAGPAVSLAEWYGAMIKNEADDFSILYHLVHSLPDIKHAALVVAPITAAYLVLFRRWRSDLNLWALAAVPALYALGAAIEYLGMVKVSTPLSLIFIPLTPGYRMLNYAYFPLVVMAARILLEVATRWLGRSPALRRATLAATLALAALALAAPLARPTADSTPTATLAYARWSLRQGRAEGLDSYVTGQLQSGVAGPDYSRSRIALLDKGAWSYPGERDPWKMADEDARHPWTEADDAAMERVSAQNIIALCQTIRTRVPKAAGLFIPPHVRYMRDCALDNAIFFQERHDGNFMLGSPGIYAFWRPRMIDLLGMDYEAIPFKANGLGLALMRRAYLSIDGAKAAALYARYPAYRYFVAEQGHQLPYAKIAETSAFILYDLGRPAE